jgi:hypothetical protein
MLLVVDPALVVAVDLVSLGACWYQWHSNSHPSDNLASLVGVKVTLLVAIDWASLVVVKMPSL